MGLSVSDSLVIYWRKIAEKSDTICSLEEKKYNNLSVVNQNLSRALNDEKRKGRKVAVGVGVGGAILGFILGVLLN